MPEVVSLVMVDEYAGKVHAVRVISALQCPLLTPRKPLIVDEDVVAVLPQRTDSFNDADCTRYSKCLRWPLSLRRILLLLGHSSV